MVNRCYLFAMPSGNEEAQVAAAAAQGDGQAFARLYDAYEQRIYNFCLRIVGQKHDAEDATQETFIKVLGRLPDLQDRDLNFRAYLFTAARNASYDVISRRKKTSAVGDFDDEAKPLHGERPDLDEDPERAAMLESQRLAVQAANERLPERQREVLALREVEEMSYEEIAEVMGSNSNSVAQLISAGPPPPAKRDAARGRGGRRGRLGGLRSRPAADRHAPGRQPRTGSRRGLARRPSR